jgi:hypothetical protein
MENTNDSLTFAENPNADKIPTSLNVLTILTFIGCGLGLLGTIAAPLLSKFAMKQFDKIGDVDMPTKQMVELQKSKALIELQMDNMIPIIIISLVGIALCFYGALMMRKFKKDGFWLYTAGEILPVIATTFLLGQAQFVSIWSYSTFLFPIVFVVLYFFQRKHLYK